MAKEMAALNPSDIDEEVKNLQTHLERPTVATNSPVKQPPQEVTTALDEKIRLIFQDLTNNIDSVRVTVEKVNKLLDEMPKDIAGCYYREVNRAGHRMMNIVHELTEAADTL